MIQWHPAVPVPYKALQVGDVIVWDDKTWLVLIAGPLEPWTWVTSETGDYRELDPSQATYPRIGEASQEDCERFAAVTTLEIQAARRRIYREAFHALIPPGTTRPTEETRSRVVDLRELESQRL